MQVFGGYYDTNHDFVSTYTGPGTHTSWAMVAVRGDDPQVTANQKSGSWVNSDHTAQVTVGADDLSGTVDATVANPTGDPRDRELAGYDTVPEELVHPLVERAPH